MRFLRAAGLIVFLALVACSPNSPTSQPDQSQSGSNSVGRSDGVDSSAASSEAEPPTYAEAQAAWRTERAERLQQPDSWLSLVGLHWLDDGESTFGSAVDNTIVLPDSAPDRAGVLVREGDVVRLEPLVGAGVTVDGKPAAETVLTADADGDPTLVEIGTASFFVIRRGEKLGLRVRDSQSPGLKKFTGLDWYAVDPELRIEARFEPYSESESGKTPRLKIPNILGQILDTPSPGVLVFEIDGKTVELAPILYEGTDEFFVIFGDATNGKGTYGAGRFLYAELPDENGTVILDFNQAYSPPCAYTEFATCPLPPRRNRLKVAIEAGEKDYPGGHG